MTTDKRPDGWTDRHEVIAQALYADTWIEPKDDDPHPDWHRRFQWWQCVKAASLVIPALQQFDRTPVGSPNINGLDHNATAS